MLEFQYTKNILREEERQKKLKAEEEKRNDHITTEKNVRLRIKIYFIDASIECVFKGDLRSRVEDKKTLNLDGFVWLISIVHAQRLIFVK